MNTLRFALAGLVFAGATLVSSQADARLVHFPRLRHRSYNVDPFSLSRGGGPTRRIYPVEYDAARAYHGGRGDNRWRWNPDPGNRPANLYPFGWPGGSPWNW